jgi:hypothetical protein
VRHSTIAVPSALHSLTTPPLFGTQGGHGVDAGCVSSRQVGCCGSNGKKEYQCNRECERVLWLDSEQEAGEHARREQGSAGAGNKACRHRENRSPHEHENHLAGSGAEGQAHADLEGPLRDA